VLNETDSDSALMVVSATVVECTNIPLPEDIKVVLTSRAISLEEELNKLLVDDTISVVDSVVSPTLEVGNVDEMVDLDCFALLDEVEAD